MRVVIVTVLVALVVWSAPMMFSSQAVHAQTLSAGCEFLNNPDFDGSYGSGGGGPFAFAAGETVTVAAAENPENTGLTAFGLEITTPTQTLFAQTSDIPGTLSYTFVEDVDDATVLWGPAGTFTVSCDAASEPPPPETTGQGYVQFNHASEVSVTRTERPQLVVQFGNNGSEVLENVSLSCAITSGEATFDAGQIYPGGFGSSGVGRAAVWSLSPDWP